MALNQDKNSYSNIFKAIGLFGGVKVIQIIVNIIKSKAIAILIGPSGMGVVGLLQSSIEVVNQVAGCGLQTSAVREVSKSVSEGNEERIGIVISTLHKLVWLTGLLGTIIVFLLSDQLSIFAFGEEKYSLDFKYLSIILLLTQLNVGQIALLQGSFRYRDMAKASLWGSLLGLIVVIPIYYFLREKGIVPSLIISAVVSLFFSWMFSKKITYKKISLNLKSYILNSKDMIYLGGVLALGVSLSTASGYLMNVFLSLYGSSSIVGLYHAAYQVANSYVLLVLSSMSTDYIPRLSAMCNDSEAQMNAINKQSLMVVLILLPLLTLLMVFAREIVVILYSTDFTSISPMITILMFGMLFRSVSWCMAYSLIARGDSKSFLLCEAIASMTSLLFKIAGYIIGGFIGMGVGFVVNYVVYLMVLYLICNKTFRFSFTSEMKRVFAKGQCLLFICLIVCLIPYSIVCKFIIGSIIIAISCFFSYTELRNRIDIKSLFQYLHK